MTKTELKPLYADAAVRARCAPNASELAVWMSQLGDADIRDLKSAIDLHFEKSQWMPKEGELKPLIEQARKARVAGSVSPRSTYARWECPDHAGMIVGAFIDPLDFRPRRCPKVISDTVRNENGAVICGARMVEIFRQENFTTGNRTVADKEAA